MTDPIPAAFDFEALTRELIQKAVDSDRGHIERAYSEAAAMVEAVLAAGNMPESMLEETRAALKALAYSAAYAELVGRTVEWPLWVEWRSNGNELSDNVMAKAARTAIAEVSTKAAREKHAARTSEEMLTASKLSLSELTNPSPPVFVIAHMFVRSELHLLVSESGTGKSTLALLIAIRLALNRPALVDRHKPFGPGRVAYVSAEDRKPQIAHRLSKLIEAEEIGDAQRATIAERLAVFDVTETDAIALTTMEPRTQRRFISDFAERLEGWLEAGKFDLVFVDPLGMFIGGSENSNDDVMPLMRWLRGLARRLDVAIVLIHHTGKSSARDGASDQHVGRGASAMNSNARWMGHLLPLRESRTEFNDVTYEVPREVGEGDRLLLKNHKATHMLADPPVVIRRVGWRLEAFDMNRIDGAQATRQRLTEDDQALLEWLRRVASPENSISQREALARRAEYGGQHPNGRSAISEDRATAAWSRLAERGVLILDMAAPPGGRGAPSLRCFGTQEVEPRDEAF